MKCRRWKKITLLRIRDLALFASYKVLSSIIWTPNVFKLVSLTSIIELQAYPIQSISYEVLSNEGILFKRKRIQMTAVQ